MIYCPLCGQEMSYDVNLECKQCGYKLNVNKDATAIAILSLANTIEECIKL